MSAADLFKNSYDVEFRLKGTWIMIGRDPYYIHMVHPKGSTDPATCILKLEDLKGEEHNVELGKLPLTAMTACPWGYYDGIFYARGPARHRFQGITGSSFWAIMPNGAIDTGGVGNPKTLLKQLPLQPRTRRPGKRPSGAVTRDVFINGQNYVMVRGIIRAQYVGKNIIKPLGEISPMVEQLLKNAKLMPMLPQGEQEPTVESNPCAEIIL